MAGNIAEPHVWKKADFARRLCRVLDTARYIVELFGENGINYPKKGDKIQPEKIVGETAHLIFASSALKACDGVEKRLNSLAMLLAPHARNQKTLLNICLHPSFALDYAQPHLCLTAAGYPDEKFDALLCQVADERLLRGHERTPHRALEQEWIKGLGGKWQPQTNGLLGYTAFANEMDLLHTTTNDVYAFTHALLYASGNGTNDLKRLETESINFKAEAMLAKCLDEENYDLAGELVLTWPLLELPWSATAVFALRVLTGVEDEAGLLPSPSIDLDVLDRLAGEEKKEHLYAATYHTVYVMGLVCSAILKQTELPPYRLQSNESLRGATPHLLPFLKGEDCQPHWLAFLHRLDPDEQDALAPFLLQVAILRNVRRKNYNTVYQLLKTGYELCLANNPLMYQASILLERLNLLSIAFQ